MLTFSSIAIIAFLPSLQAAPSRSNAKQLFQFAVLGDSWASGVSYNRGSEYDDNSSRCMRAREAYGPQMHNNASWASSGVNFTFPACSGTHLGDTYIGDRCQACDLENPNVTLIVTSGGNDVGFFAVVDGCIYHSNKDADYGKQLDEDRNRTGACARAIDGAKGFMSPGDNQFEKRLKSMYSGLLESQHPNSKVLIYQTGYVHFFNVDEGSNWCNNHLFKPCSGIRVSRQVREELNELVEQANRVVRGAIASFNDNRVRFVSITKHFNGHRFCETGMRWVDQWIGSKVWIYNALPQVTLPEYYFPQDESQGVNPNGSCIAADSNPQTQLPWPATLWPSDPGNSGDGWRMRPFHPKLIGHAAIKDAVIAQFKADKVPGVNL